MQAINNDVKKSYPGIDLGRTYQYFLRLKENNPTKPLKTNEVMHAIGYSQRGGRVSRVLSAFRQFGLANFDGTFYTLTDLGKDILRVTPEDPTHKELVIRAAKSPELYKFLYAKTKGKRELYLSDDEFFKIMLDYGIEQTDMVSILKNYKETLKFIDHGVTFELQPSPVKAENESMPMPKGSAARGVIRINFGEDLIVEVPRELVLQASLRDLAKNGSSSGVRLIPRH